MEVTNNYEKVKDSLLIDQLNIFQARLLELNEKSFKDDSIISFFDLVLLDNTNVKNIYFSYPPERNLNEAKKLEELASINFQEEVEEVEELLLESDNKNTNKNHKIKITPIFYEVIEKEGKKILQNLKSENSQSKETNIYQTKEILEIENLLNKQKNREVLKKHLTELLAQKEKLQREYHINFNKSKNRIKKQLTRNFESERNLLNKKIKAKKRDIRKTAPLIINRKNNGLLGLKVINQVGPLFKNNSEGSGNNDSLKNSNDVTLNSLKTLYKDENNLKYVYACKGNYFSQRKEDKKITYIKFIFTIGYQKDNFIKNANDYLKLHETSLEFEAIINNLIHTRVISNYKHEILALYKEIIRNATRAAISQVMARNGSHNIGSHVLADFVIKLSDSDYNFYTQEVFIHLFRLEFDENDIPFVNFIQGKNRTYQGLCFNRFETQNLSLNEKDYFQIYYNRYYMVALEKIKSAHQKRLNILNLESREKKLIENIKNNPKNIGKFLRKYKDIVIDIYDEHQDKEEYRKSLVVFCNKYSRLLQSRFSSYIKTRMDFQADIASTTPTLQNSKHLIKDILQYFDDNRILMNRISGLENFNFFINVLIKTKGRCNSKVGKKCACPENHIEDDVLVSIPNDILGNHALFILLENIIRNSAKHGRGNPKALSTQLNKKNGFEFTIEIREPILKELSDYYEVYIYDSIEQSNETIILTQLEKENLEKECLDYAFEEDFSMNQIFNIARDKEFYSKNWDNDTAPFEIKAIDKLIIEQNIRLNKNIIQDNNQPRTGALGLVEMDVATTYLRKIPVEQCDEQKFDIQASSFLLPYDSKNRKNFFGFKGNENKEELYLLKALNIDNKLAYRFYLLKPVNTLIISNHNFKLSNISKYNMKRYGIEIITGKEYEKNKNTRIYNHEFLIYTSKIFEENFKDVKLTGLFPYRRIFIPHDLLFNIFEKLDIKNSKTNSGKDILELLNKFSWIIWLYQQTQKRYAKTQDGEILLNEIISTKFNQFSFKHKDTDSSINISNEASELEKEYGISLKQRTNVLKKIRNSKENTYKINFMNHGNKESWEGIKKYNYAQPSKDIAQKCLPNYSNQITLDSYHLDWSKDWIENNLPAACQIVESCIHSIGIIDERIQVFSKVEFSEGLTFSEIFPKMNIYQPQLELDEKLIDDIRAQIQKEKNIIEDFPFPEVIDLNKQEYTISIYEDLVYWLELYSKTLDTLIIHITVLEKCLTHIRRDFTDVNSHDLLKEFINKYIRDHNENINLIFTSGRGKPELLPEDEKFLPFSIISQALCEKNSKYALMSAIVNARKLQKN